MARIKKGDLVTVLTGKDRGKSGKVLRVEPVADRALVERLNLAKHFVRRSQEHPNGGIIEREGWLSLAKLALHCPRCRRPVRVGWVVGDGGKQRVCRRCRETL